MVQSMASATIAALRAEAEALANVELATGSQLLEQAPANLVIRTRHGYWMKLTEFATIRVVELGVARVQRLPLG